MRLVSPQICSGCGSCAVACPKGCITMTEDSEGFRYPRVDTARCVECGACTKACPVRNPLLVSQRTEAVAAKHQNTELRMQSSSGGVFSALAEYFITRGGAVCAAVYEENFSVVHHITQDIAEIARFRGAKYVQSETEQCFPKIKRLLEDNVQVLFVGTPCQVAGLKRYLGKEYENLLLVDMICHGVPSPVVWMKHLQDQTNEAGAPISSVNLRSKATGWSGYGYSVEMHHENGAVYSAVQNQDWFMRGFTGDLYLRPSCGNCFFKGVERCSDLTLGDCWGIWETHPEFDDNKGTSLLLLQSEKGRKTWDTVKESFVWIPINTEEAVFHNPSAVYSSAAHPRRTEFFERFRDEDSIVSLIKECLCPTVESRPSLLTRIRNKLLSRR